MFGDITHESQEEKEARENLTAHFRDCPIPDTEIISNLGLFLTSKTLSRILFMNHLYQKIIDTHGVIMDFGTRWGQNATLFSALRGIYEPFNSRRKIVAFDTFCGFPVITEADGNSPLMKVGGDGVTKDYELYLDKLLSLHEGLSPVSHIRKFEIIKGDAEVKLEKYLDDNPETIISLAYFDFDLYSPTATCLGRISPHLAKGSILAFDELNDHDSPGETIALKQMFHLNQIKLERFRYVSRTSYFVL